MATKKRNTRKWTTSEQKSYRKGFFAGLFASKKEKKVTVKKSTVKKRPTIYDWHNVQMRDDNKLYLLCYRFAKHMQNKSRDLPSGGISDEQALKNARIHYYEALKDKKFRDRLTFEYDY